MKIHTKPLRDTLGISIISKIQFRFFVIALFLQLYNIVLQAQTVNIRDFDQPGTYTYTVPDGITELVIECWGGGGGGSAAIGMRQHNAAPGAGGGGGAHAHSVLKVTPGEVFSFRIGAGGAGGVNPYTLGEGSGKSGEDTFFSNSLGERLIIAEGGRGASFAWLSQGGSIGGSGGRYFNSKGTVIHTGGRGGDAGENFSGGGGGAGGRTHEGYNAVGMTAGSPGSCYCGIPGAGGAGLNVTGNGKPGINVENVARGVIYTAGGGGGAYDADWDIKNGGKGANGHIRIKEQIVIGDIIGTPYTEVGESTQLIAPIPGGSWRSSLTDIATVDETGLVTGHNPGETIISYSIGNFLTGQSTEIHIFVYPEGQSIAINGMMNYCESGGNDINLYASTAMSGDLHWYWTGPGGFLRGGQGFTREAISENSGSYTVTVSRFSEGIQGQDKIQNGSFEQGNIGFSSDYIYNANSQINGDYNVGVRPKHWAFSESCADHTSASGNYFSLLGNGNAGTVWQQVVSVDSNSDYQLSCWLQAMQHASHNIPTDIEVQVEISGVNVGEVFSLTTSKNCGGWSELVSVWNSGNNTSAVIKLKLNKTLSSNYQIGLDDISFRKIASDEFSRISATVNISVADSFTPSIQIIPAPSIPLEGQVNKFIASATNGGISPTYVWSVNGVEVQRSTNLLFTSSSLVENDVVVCELIPDAIFCIVSETKHYSEPVIVKKELNTNNYWHGLTSDKWYVIDNWTQRRIPSQEEDIEFATIENSGVQVQNNLMIASDVSVSNYINESDKKLIIASGVNLTVNGQINTNNTNKILIQASETEPNGSLIFPNAVAPFATVQMWSNASISDGGVNNSIKWQYFGTPVDNLTASPTFNGAYIRIYDEGKQTTEPGYQWDKLINSSVMYPFIGYEITQSSPSMYNISGRLVKDNFYRELVSTPGSYYSGQHLFSNPYTAAIDIPSIGFGEGLDHTIYIYNTGSYADWTTGIAGESNAGSYTSVPKAQAQAMGLRGIPSMQGFLVRVLDVTKNCSFSFNYNEVVSPNRQQVRLVAEKRTLEISIKSEHHADKAWLFLEDHCSSDFDNGWDGVKMFSSSGVAQLFLLENDKAYQVSSTNNIHDTYLGIYAGEKDVNYTLHLKPTNVNTSSEELYLLDMKTGVKFRVPESGLNYKFNIAPNEKSIDRFRLLLESAMLNRDKGKDVSVYTYRNTLYIDNKRSEVGRLSVIDLSGKTVGRYVFSQNSVTTIPLSFLSGMYVVRYEFGNQMYSLKVLLSD